MLAMAEEVNEGDESLNSMIDKLAEVSHTKASNDRFYISPSHIWNKVYHLTS